MATAEKFPTRKLTAILMADVVGYSYLMGEDEAGTLSRLKAHRDHLVNPLIQTYRGRIVNLMGDGALVEFPSVLEAVACALKIQEGMVERNKDVSESKKIQFRIGVNLSDVIVEGEDIHGDGVNITARLETLAKPGGVCVSDPVRVSIGKKLPLDFKDMGEQQVKNIVEPVRAYDVRLISGETLPKPADKELSVGPTKAMSKRWRFTAGVIMAALITAVGALMWSKPWLQRVEPALVERMAFPLPEKPSIAVLPFTDTNGDLEQAYFSDGLTENLITTLSQLPDVFVIARNSTFSYRDNPVQIQKVAEELAVRYVVTGSYQKVGDRIRVHAQFVDAVSGIHLWADRYDRPWSDIFELQDDLTLQIVSSLSLKLSEEQRIQLSQHYTKDPEAYDYFLRGQAAFYGYSPQTNAQAREMYQRAIDRDPNFARAISSLALTYAYDFRFGWSEDKAGSLRRAQELSQQALKLDNSLPQTHLVASAVHQFGKDHKEAIKAGQRAITLDKNYADAYVTVAFSQTYLGNAVDAIELIKKAIRLNPNTPSLYYVSLGRALFFAGQLEEAKLYLKRAAELNPTFLITRVMLAAVWGQLGDQDEAEWEVEEILMLDPDFSIEAWLSNEPLVNTAYAERLRRSLQRAGLPEKVITESLGTPTIAVLPFANMSSDPEQEYFADGMTDDLITDLSKAAGLFVIARNSSFVYKGQNVDVRVIADKLGVRYVLEGSVRKMGDTVRINAQLIDAETGGHLWAERYDGRLDEIFIFQDGITEKIVAALAVKLSHDEQQIIKKRDTVDIEAYELFLKGQERFFTYSSKGTLEAQELLGKAIARDPKFARAYAMLAWTHWFQFSTAQSDNPETSLQRAIEQANLAIAANDTLPVAYFVKALVLRERREYAKAVAEAEKAIRIDPNYANGYVILATVLYYTGRAEEGLDRIKKAMRLEPLHSQNFIWHLGQAYFILGRYDEAIETFHKALEKNPVSERTKLWLAAAYVQVGQIGDAEFELEEVLLLNPNLTMERIRRAYPFWYYADLENFLDSLSKAGLE